MKNNRPIQDMCNSLLTLSVEFLYMNVQPPDVFVEVIAVATELSFIDLRCGMSISA